jgi:hypothetical protein
VHNIYAVLDLCGLLLATVPGSLHTFAGALLNHFLEPHTSSCEPCLYCSLWHSQEMCSFANAEALDGAQLKGSAQSGREPGGCISECFRNFSLAIYLFGIGSSV